MIVVKIELHSAITRKVTTIGQMIIHNVGGTSDRGNYEVCVARKSENNFNLRKTFHNPVRRGSVKNHPRKTQNVWRLVTKALLSAFPEEDKTKE